MCVCLSAQSLSVFQLFLNPWTIAHQAPPSIKFSTQEYWSGLPFPSPRAFPDPGIEPMSPMFPELTDGFFTTSSTWEASYGYFSYPQKNNFNGITLTFQEKTFKLKTYLLSLSNWTSFTLMLIFQLWVSSRVYHKS